MLGAGVIPRRLGNAHPSIRPYESLHCADARIIVACGNNEQFARFVQIIGVPELASDTRFATNAQRSNRVLLVPALELPRRTRTAGAWHPLFAAGGVPSGIIGTIADGLALAIKLGLDPTIEVHDAWATCWVRRFVTPSSGHRRSPATTFRRPSSASTVRMFWSGSTLSRPAARARGARQSLGHRGRRQ
ncbi:CoA-transferase family III [Salinibacterium xinjiangense]|uniref:CoA-transferase family III n=1 Tax=Salinibacterium xinjiangense TaxID=386302 RepID=A0A2C8ZV04_9MICO|nr:CoA-transferase family III [Salinibacterium xinjiangense]